MVGHLQFMIGRKHNLAGHLIFPRVFPVVQKARCVFCLVGHCPMSNHYLNARCFEILKAVLKITGRGSFLLPSKILGLKNPAKITLTIIYCKAILFDSLPISFAIWIIMLIFLQIHEVLFEIFFQSFMKFLPPAFNLKF